MMSTKKKEDDKAESSSLSFLQYPMLWLHMVSAPRMNFWGMDQFFVLNMVGFVIVATNEVAMIPVAINLVFIFLLTLGSPLWRGFRERHGWTELGEAQGLMIPIEIALLFTQSAFFPVFLFVQFLIVFFPIFVFSASYFPGGWPTFDHFWHEFFTNSDYWLRFSDFSWWFWVIEVYWVVVFVVSLHLTLINSRKQIPLFNPISSYYWLIKRVFAGRLWGFYKNLLIIPTKWCYKHRKTMGCLGELLMFPLFLAWVGWPIIIPFYTSLFVFIASAPASAFLVYEGYFLVKSSWSGRKVEVPDTPTLTLTSARVELPSTGGVVMTLTGVKDPDFSVVQVKWIFDGKELWSALGEVFGYGVISGIKMTLYPIDLIPALMDPEDLGVGKREFVMYIRAGTAESGRVLKNHTVVKKLRELQEHGNPAFKMVFEYGVNRFGWKKMGTLCSFDTDVAAFLLAAESGESLVQADNAAAAVEIPRLVLSDVHAVEIPDAPLKPSDNANIAFAKKKRPSTNVQINSEIEEIKREPKTSASSLSQVALKDSLSVTYDALRVEEAIDPVALNLADAVNVDYSAAVNALRLHNGNTDQAANYLLSQQTI